MVSQLQYQPRKSDLLDVENSIALLYHDIFEYPLTVKELARWRGGPKLKLRRGRPKTVFLDGFFVLKNKEAQIEKRRIKEEISRKKLKMLATIVPYFKSHKNVLMIGITGSLAMQSSTEDSDIDLMIVTRKGTLWTTRLGVLLYFLRNKTKIRRAGNTDQVDRLCLNMWLDEEDLIIEPNVRSPYTAHEIAQVLPLVNKEHIFEEFVSKNLWVKDYWPNALNSAGLDTEKSRLKIGIGYQVLEKVAYLLQKIYMSRKITREVVAPTRAFFHPFDWNLKMKKELEERGVFFD